MSPVIAGYLTNAAQAAAAIALMLLITAPVGIAAFRLLLRLTGAHPRLGWQQIPVAVGVGMLIVPFALSIAGLLLDGIMRPVWVIAISMALFAVLLRLDALIPPSSAEPHPALTRRQSLMLLGIAAAALAVVIGLLGNNTPQTDQVLAWRTVGTGDYSKHFGIISMLATHDHLPPPNPFVVIDSTLRYYYHFYMLPASAMRLSQHWITVGNAFTAATMLIAVIFPFTLFELARRLRVPITGALIAAALASLIGGVDIIYMAMTYFDTGIWPDHIDAWSPVDERRVSSIATMFIWTPQHVFGLIGFMLVIWLLASIIRQRTLSVPTTISAAILIAAITGASIYVWIGLAAGLGLFALIETLRARQLPLNIIIPTVLGLILSVPTLILLSGRDAAPFIIRIAQPPDGLRYGALFTRLLGTNQFAYLLDFPAHMLLEFGIVAVLGLAAIWLLRRRWPDDPAFRLCLAMLIASSLVVLLIRDPAGRNNDFALRVSPIMAIMLAVLAGWGWSHRSESRVWRNRAFQGAAALLLALGLASTIYEVTMRVTAPDVVTADEHDLYHWMNASLAPDVVYQYGRMGTHTALVLAERRLAAAPSHIAYLYAANPNAVTDMFKWLTVGFNSPDAADCANGFKHLGITYVIADDTELSVIHCESEPDFATYFDLVYSNDTYRVYHLR